MASQYSIIDFLRARLDEDEREARVRLGRGGSSHRWSRVLAEVAAKRRIVDLHDAPQIIYGTAKWACLQCDSVGEEPPCQTLRLLATVWSDNPDYLQEWRPLATV